MWDEHRTPSKELFNIALMQTDSFFGQIIWPFPIVFFIFLSLHFENTMWKPMKPFWVREPEADVWGSVYRISLFSTCKVSGEAMILAALQFQP